VRNEVECKQRKRRKERRMGGRKSVSQFTKNKLRKVDNSRERWDMKVKKKKRKEVNHNVICY
jgi:hypothetical protein